MGSSGGYGRKLKISNEQIPIYVEIIVSGVIAPGCILLLQETAKSTRRGIVDFTGGLESG